MKQYRYEEFIKFSKEFQRGRHDFYGEYSPLSDGEKKAFLNEYVEYHKKTFGENAIYEKAADKREVKRLAAVLSREQEDDFTFTAYKRKLPQVYKGWNFYTDRAYMQDGKIVLSDNHAWPVPCAKFEMEKSGVTEVSFRVKIGGGYKVSIPSGILPTTTGRYIELRKGCTERIKLYFSPKGDFCFKDATKNIYHYSLHTIAEYAFDHWNDVMIRIEKDSFVLTFNGIERSFDVLATDIDTVFLGGGMQPVDDWCVEPVYYKDAKGNKKEFFQTATFTPSEDEYIGEVKLPYAIGTQRNKDEALVLKSPFKVGKNSKCVLEVDSLDPGGQISVNGKIVAQKDDFQAFSLDIRNYVQEGENELEILVYPRAPESLFAWHKNNDYYSGWLCQGIRLKTNEIYIESPIVIKTERIGAYTDFSVKLSNIFSRQDEYSFFRYGDYSYRIYLQKTYPETEEKRLIREGRLSRNQLYERFSMPLQLWSVEFPNLYTVRIEIFTKDKRVYQGEIETGFRIIEQKDGQFYLNHRKIRLKGALNMQFLPPYEEIPVNHVCPSDEQILEQLLMLKNMNGNCIRMHQLGYGSNDKRFAVFCDRLGILLIWTTRYIDSAENIQWTEKWCQAEEYKKQIRAVKNHPSIIMYEGSNELHADLELIDKLYDAFVSAVKEEDDSRLLSPVSHLYYGGGIYDMGCKYYNDIGTTDEDGKPVVSSYGWKDENVVRSAHTYSLLLGYGSPWSDMVTQNWKLQSELFLSTEKAYMISEFAVIGRQNPNTEEAKRFINKNSYELQDELEALGFIFTDEEWELSQSFQALCASVATKQLRKNGADAMLWCCLTGGANNGSYLKPTIDFYGYKKWAFYQLKESFQAITAFNAETDVLWYDDYTVKPFVCGLEIGKQYSLKVEILGKDDKVEEETVYAPFIAASDAHYLLDWKPTLKKDGYYTVRYTVTSY